jgi:hypothetical protein
MANDRGWPGARIVLDTVGRVGVDLAREVAMKRRHLVGLVLFLVLGTVVWLCWCRRPLLRAQKFIEGFPRFVVNPDMFYKFDYSNIEQHPKWPLAADVMASGDVVKHGGAMDLVIELCPAWVRGTRGGIMDSPRNDECSRGSMPLDPFCHKSDCPYGILVSYLFFQGAVSWGCID